MQATKLHLADKLTGPTRGSVLIMGGHPSAWDALDILQGYSAVFWEVDHEPSVSSYVLPRTLVMNDAPGSVRLAIDTI